VSGDKTGTGPREIERALSASVRQAWPKLLPNQVSAIVRSMRNNAGALRANFRNCCLQQFDGAETVEVRKRRLRELFPCLSDRHLDWLAEALDPTVSSLTCVVGPDDRCFTLQVTFAEV